MKYEDGDGGWLLFGPQATAVGSVEISDHRGVRCSR